MTPFPAAATTGMIALHSLETGSVTPASAKGNTDITELLTASFAPKPRVALAAGLALSVKL
ncbi:MAG: hypothetical protein U9R47_01670 [Actinomycetota bacterium]|nr:hypothetical protein [Actinomycetota bacterium]